LNVVESFERICFNQIVWKPLQPVNLNVFCVLKIRRIKCIIKSLQIQTPEALPIEREQVFEKLVTIY